MAPRVLVVDDEPPIRDLIGRSFEGSGYEIQEAGNATEALEHLRRFGADLVLLDIQLPDTNGLEVCRKIRSVSSVPVIMLTGLRNESDVIAGLQAGADDYITKPFSPRELLARVEANLRRRAMDTAPEESRVELDGGRFALDFAARTVRVGEREAPLTPREFALLSHLALNNGRVVPHDELIRQVWGDDDPARIIDLRTYVKLIRRKIEPDPAHPRYLQSRPGSGYYIPSTWPA